MIYKNKRTGNVIDVPCEIRGDDWEEVKASQSSKTKKAGDKDGTVRNPGRRKQNMETSKV